MLFSSHDQTRYQSQECVTMVTTVVGDTFDADLSSALEWQLWAFGGYRKHVAELFGHLVRPGHWCVDVGANIGVHTVRLARLVADGGEVIAIEPDPDVVTRINRNIGLNGLTNVRVIGAAAGQRAGLLAERGYVMLRIRSARHLLTGRVRLALDRVQERSPAARNFLVVCGATAASISSLAG
jgi:Met-10+ like-protein